MALADVDSLALHMRVDLSHADDAATAGQLLDDATATIEDEAGQPLEESTDTIDVDGTGTCRLVLPRWPVNSVTSVAETDAVGVTTVLTEGEGADYTWGTEGILIRLGAVWPCGQRNIAVVYTPGYSAAAMPAELARICRRLAAAGWYNPAGANTEQTSDHHVKWATAGAELTAAERRTIGRYAAGNR